MKFLMDNILYVSHVINTSGGIKPVLRISRYRDDFRYRDGFRYRESQSLDIESCLDIESHLDIEISGALVLCPHLY